MIVKSTVRFEHPASAIWKLVGGFDLLPLINKNTASSRLEDGGRVRVLVNRDGSVLRERLLEFSEQGRSLAYEIFETVKFSGCYGVGYRGHITVREEERNVAVMTYVADFDPAPGVSAAVAEADIHAFVNNCADGIRQRLLADQQRGQ